MVGPLDCVVELKFFHLTSSEIKLGEMITLFKNNIQVVRVFLLR